MVSVWDLGYVISVNVSGIIEIDDSGLDLGLHDNLSKILLDS